MEAGGSRIQGHPQLHSDYEVSLGYIEILFQKKKEREVGAKKGKASFF